MNAADRLVEHQPDDDEPGSEPEFGPVIRSISGLLGVAAGGAGAAAVFTTENEVGSAALLAIAVYFVLSTILGRFPRLKLGENEIDPSLRRSVREARRVSEQAKEEAEDVKEGLQHVLPRGPGVDNARSEPGAAQPDERVSRLAAEYNRLRWTMPSGQERTDKMTDIVEQMIAVFRDLDAVDAEPLLSSEDRGLRLAGVAAVYARPDPGAVAALAGVALTPDKPFNEYWAFLTLRKVLAGNCEYLDADLRSRLSARLRELPPWSDQAQELRAILRQCP